MSDMKQALSDIMGKAPVKKKTPDAIKKLDQKTKSITFRFNREDLAKLERFCKSEYGIDSTSQIMKKVLYNFMDERGIL
jgi:hypothetical protein